MLRPTKLDKSENLRVEVQVRGVGARTAPTISPVIQLESCALHRQLTTLLSSRSRILMGALPLLPCNVDAELAEGLDDALV